MAMAGVGLGLYEWTGEGELEDPGVSLGQHLLDHMKKHAVETDFPAQVDATTGREMSFSSLLELSVGAALGWRSLGLGPSSTLCVFAKNSEMLFPAVLGAFLQGVAVGGVSPTSTEGELRHCLALLQPDVVLCDPANANLASRVSTGYHVIVQDADDCPLGGGVRTLKAVFQAAGDVASFETADVGDPREHVAAVFFSSGTTGLPKAVMRSDSSLTRSIAHLIPAFCCVRGDRLLCTSLMSWVTGIGLLMAATASATTRICGTFTGAGALLADLRRYEANCWFTAPPLMLMVAEAARSSPGAEGDSNPCPSLRSVVVGGTALTAAMQEAAARVMHCDILQAYASTEFSVVSFSRRGLSRPGSSGRVAAGVRVRIVDVDTGCDIRVPGVPGELWVLSPCVMTGYKNNPEATAEAFDEHGYCCSGDFAYLDHDGFLFIVGRLKELLKYKGGKVAPGELEAVLKEHPGVAEVCVIGRPHAICGDVPAACVVRRQGHHVTEQELQQLVADHLSANKRLRGGVLFVAQIPKTSNGKVARRDIVPFFDGHPMQELD